LFEGNGPVQAKVMIRYRGKTYQSKVTIRASKGNRAVDSDTRKSDCWEEIPADKLLMQSTKLTVYKVDGY